MLFSARAAVRMARIMVANALLPADQHRYQTRRAMPVWHVSQVCRRQLYPRQARQTPWRLSLPHPASVTRVTNVPKAAASTAGTANTVAPVASASSQRGTCHKCVEGSCIHGSHGKHCGACRRRILPGHCVNTIVPSAGGLVPAKNLSGRHVWLEQKPITAPKALAA